MCFLSVPFISWSCGVRARYGLPRIVCVVSLLGLCLACQSDRSLQPEDSAARPVIFRDAAPEARLAFRHFIGATGKYYLPEIMGGGAAWIDHDGDGDLDAYLLQGALLDSSKTPQDAQFPPPASHWPGNRLFRNEFVPSGELRFSDVTDQAGVGHLGYSMGVAVGDYDNDGDADLYVTNFGSNVLYSNGGDGTFQDVTEHAGVDDARWSTAATFTDYDRDGNLDLLVVNYVDFSVEGNKDCYDAIGARTYCSPSVYRPLPDRLFRNEGGGRFRDVSRSAGLGAAFGSGLGVISGDFNSDGWPDFYVANDGNANQLWMNQGDGTFSDEALLAGAAYNANGVAEAGMGVTSGDFDQDGDEDLFMTHLTQETNTLYVNDGAGNFIDVTSTARLANVSLALTGFGTNWFDYDNDGLLDLFIANGAVTIVEALRGEDYPFGQVNQLLRNTGSVYEDVSSRAGEAFSLVEVSRAAAFGDADNDGDIDILLANNNGPARLLLNEVGSLSDWLGVVPKGAEGRSGVLGAKVGLLRQEKAPVWKRARTGGSYLSANDPRVLFGLGPDAPAVDGIVIAWPSGRQEVWKNVPVGQYVELLEGAGEVWNPPGL